MGEIEGDLCGIEGPAHIAVARECPLEGLGRLVWFAGPPRGRAQEAEVVRREPSVTIGGAERLDRLRPRVAGDRVPTRFECLDMSRAHWWFRSWTLDRVLIIDDASNNRV